MIAYDIIKMWELTGCGGKFYDLFRLSGIASVP